MTRADWLNAISLNPVCETTRLAFADWLDDHGAGDLDAATAEFVRVSCRGVAMNSTQMAKPAYKWLEANWHRLVPTLYANHGTALAESEQPSAAAILKLLDWRSGRKIGTTVYVRRPYPTDEPSGAAMTSFARDYRPLAAYLEFWKGFLITFAFQPPAFQPPGDSRFAAVKRDQPLAVELPFDYHRHTRPAPRT